MSNEGNHASPPERERSRIEAHDRDSDTPLEEWVRRARDGDERAFEALVRLVYPRVHRWAWISIGDADGADEASQDVLLTLHRKLADFRGDSSIWTWLYRVTRNAAGQVIRRRGRFARLRDRVRGVADPDWTSPPAVEEAIAAERLRTHVLGWMNELSDRQRRVFHLVDIEGHTHAEASEMEEMHPNTLRTHLFRARKAIRQRMIDEHPEWVPPHRVDGSEGGDS